MGRALRQPVLVIVLVVTLDIMWALGLSHKWFVISFASSCLGWCELTLTLSLFVFGWRALTSSLSVSLLVHASHV